jgi:hypothetical protein
MQVPNSCAAAAAMRLQGQLLSCCQMSGKLHLRYISAWSSIARKICTRPPGCWNYTTNDNSNSTQQGDEHVLKNAPSHNSADLINTLLICELANCSVLASLHVCMRHPFG